MSTTAATTETDTRVMNAVHTYYRRELRLAGGLVRRVAPGDTTRAREVAAHLDMVARSLHHHHTAEDELLWPLLLERVPEELAPLVHLMESQHHAVEQLQRRIDEVRPRWVEHASAADRDALADLHDALFAHLAEHLEAEEQRLLPVAARAVTQEEWDAMGERARSGTPRSESLLSLGMIAHDADPDVVRGVMLAEAPAPVRAVLLRLARRAFRRHALRIHGTATP